MSLRFAWRVKMVDIVKDAQLDEEDEETGIDLKQHGEAGYND